MNISNTPRMLGLAVAVAIAVAIVAITAAIFALGPVILTMTSAA
jgi:preprotein translocase subunit Sec61beta